MAPIGVPAPLRDKPSGSKFIGQADRRMVLHLHAFAQLSHSQPVAGGKRLKREEGFVLFWCEFPF